MPLLYRILMRLAAIAAALGAIIGVVGAIGMAQDFGAASILFGAVALLPAAALYAIAWVVRPPLDRASLRRLWRE